MATQIVIVILFHQHYIEFMHLVFYHEKFIIHLNLNHHLYVIHYDEVYFLNLMVYVIKNLIF